MYYIYPVWKTSLMNRILLMFLFIGLPAVVNAQVFPKEGSELNYRIIGFTFPENKGAVKGTVQIAAGTFNSADSFEQRLLPEVTIAGNKVVTEVPSFGQQYTWRVIYRGKKGVINKSELHHFSVGSIPTTDTSSVRLRILKPATAYTTAYVFSDASKILYDMAGNPVWYMPYISGVTDRNTVIRDMKLSCKNTITFLANDKPHEISYDGLLLWKAPRGGKVASDSMERYHHEVTRLSNGHYMTLGTELFPMMWVKDSAKDSTLVEASEVGMSKSQMSHMKLNYGTIVEYDEQNTLVWWWKSSYFYKDIEYVNPTNNRRIYDLHENAFYYDEKRNTIHVSFKNISQILKINYPEGSMADAYGGILTPENPDDTMFSEQHGIKITKNGNLLVFNNNTNNLTRPPKIVLLKEPAKAGEKLKKIWEYSYPLDLHNVRRMPLTNGGNVVELPDESIFASLCTPYSNMFIVSKEKKLLWDAIQEKVNPGTKEWMPMTIYRASIISSRDELEQLIWQGRK